jgi:hypothetical protein
MTKRWLFLTGTLILWIAALVVIGRTAVNSLTVPSWGNPVRGGQPPEVTRDSLVGQQFTAPLPGLYRIEVELVEGTASTPRQVAFHLKESPDADEDLWATHLDTEEIQKGKPYSIEFPAIEDSEQQTFYFYLESPDSVAGDAIAVRYGPNSRLDGATAYLHHQPVQGNLVFHTYYALNVWEKVDLLLGRMAEGRPYMLGTKGFYVGLAVVYAVVLAAFLMKIASAILDGTREGS